MRYQLGLVGTGVMAGAILDRLLENIQSLGIASNEIIAYDISQDKLAPFVKRGVRAAVSAKQVFSSANTVMLGIKPQLYTDVLKNAAPITAKNIISIMAGVNISALRKYLGNAIGVVRAMPNMPVQIGKGMTALCFDGVNKDSQEFIKNVFDVCGKTLVVGEDKFDAVTSISGSGPAYTYLFASGLIQGGIDGGLSYEESRMLALQTIEGAVGLAANQNNSDLGEMVDKVCSKGGTTIEAVKVFKSHNFEEIIRAAVKACKDKSVSMSEQLK